MGVYIRALDSGGYEYGEVVIVREDRRKDHFTPYGVAPTYQEACAVVDRLNEEKETDQ